MATTQKPNEAEVNRRLVLKIVARQSPKFGGDCPVAQFPLVLNQALTELVNRGMLRVTRRNGQLFVTKG